MNSATRISLAVFAPDGSLLCEASQDRSQMMPNDSLWAVANQTLNDISAMETESFVRKSGWLTATAVITYEDGYELRINSIDILPGGGYDLGKSAMTIVDFWAGRMDSLKGADFYQKALAEDPDKVDFFRRFPGEYEIPLSR